jgi:hypothetical protein
MRQGETRKSWKHVRLCHAEGLHMPGGLSDEMLPGVDASLTTMLKQWRGRSDLWPKWQHSGESNELQTDCPW